jgi:hypothetical protein
VSKRRGRTAWLVTWEWTGEHARVPERHRIAAVVRPQTGPDTVKRIVEALNAARVYDTTDKLSALSTNPYPARTGTIQVRARSADGQLRTRPMPFSSKILCGHNPWLYARVVDNLRPADGNRVTQLEWDERPDPNPDLTSDED